MRTNRVAVVLAAAAASGGIASSALADGQADANMLSPAAIDSIAQSYAAAFGDAAPSLIQHAYGTRA